MHDQQHHNATFAGAIDRGNTRIHSLDFSHQGEYIYWTEMGMVQISSTGSFQISYPRLRRAAVTNLGGVEAFDHVQGGDVRRARDGSMIVAGRLQNQVYSIANPDAAAPTVLGPASVNSNGFTFVLHPNMALQPLVITKESPVKQRTIGEKHYELTDHLGNVRVVLSDVKEGDWDAGTSTITNYRPQLLSRADYYAFGSLLPGRNYSSDSYRFGFQGQEKDDEINGATGTSYTAEFWQYDPRVARRWNVDPVIKYHESPYAAIGNNPIWFVDLDGRDTLLVNNNSGKVLDIKVGGEDYVFGTDKNRGNKKAWKKSEQIFHQLNISGESGGSPSQKGEPLVWSKLQDHTGKFDGLLDGVTFQFSLAGEVFDEKQYDNNMQRYYQKMMFVDERFDDEAIYDIKLTSFHPKRVGEWSWYRGRLARYDDYGNILYGSAGTAIGLNTFTLTSAAEINQWGKLGTDGGRDVHQIKVGIEYYKEYLRKMATVKP